MARASSPPLIHALLAVPLLTLVSAGAGHTAAVGAPGECADADSMLVRAVGLGARRAMSSTTLRVYDDFVKGNARGAMVNGEYVAAADAKDVLPEALKGVIVYEVMRVWEGQPLYVEEHMARLRKGLAALNWDAGCLERVRADINEAIRRNGVTQQNIKVLVAMPDDDAPPVGTAEVGSPAKAARELREFVYPVATFFPPDVFYEEGVKGLVIDHERHDPNSKVLDMDLKAAFAAAYAKGYYEVFLRNHEGLVLEGSRSNVFAIKDGVLHTPPDDAVLLGVTRAHVLSVCSDAGIPVTYAPLSEPLLRTASCVFLSSTSNGPLPLRTLEMQDTTVEYTKPADEPTYQIIRTGFFARRPT